MGNAVKFSKDGGTIDLSVSIINGGVFDDKDKFKKQQLSSVAGASEGRGYIYYASDETDSETSISLSSGGSSLHSRSSASSSSSSSSATIENKIAQNHQNHRRRLRFSVKDYGKGLEPHEFENVFRPFFQTEEETKKVNGGTGLGLA